MAFLKVLEDGSHMVMMECPEAVNTLLHEFLLWEPATPPPPKKESKTRPETAKAQSDNTRATSDPSNVRPATARQTSSNGGTEEKPDSKAKKWLKIKADQWLLHYIMAGHAFCGSWKLSLSEAAKLKVGQVKVWRNAGNSSFIPVMSAAELKNWRERRKKKELQ